MIVKPRRGAGSRGVRLVADRAPSSTALGTTRRRSSRRTSRATSSRWTSSSTRGHVVAAVPRTRRGWTPASRSPAAPCTTPSSRHARRHVAERHRADGVANVQLRRDADGRPALLEVNPRFPGAMPLTIAAGVDMPSLAARPRPRATRSPQHVDFGSSPTCASSRTCSSPVDEVLVSAHAAHADGDLCHEPVDLRGDYHVHSTFSDDAAQHPGREHRRRAPSAACARSGCVDHVRASTTWVPEFVAAVARRAACPRRSTVHTGVEAKILDATGRLDVPASRAGTADRPRPDRRPPVPRPGRARGPRARPAAELDAGLSVDDGARPARRGADRRDGAHRLGASSRTVLDPAQGRARRGRPARRPPRARGRSTAAATGTIVEVNEKWQCPGPRAIAAGAGGRRRARRRHRQPRRRADVGRYDWVAPTSLPGGDACDVGSADGRDDG